MSDSARVQDTWWILYPMYGLEITDEKADLDHPMFGDCTIVSKQHFPQIADLVMAPGRLFERNLTLEQERTYNIHTMEFAVGAEPYTDRPLLHSFLAICRKGYLLPDQYYGDAPFIEDATS